MDGQENGADLQEGYISDFISGKRVRATPEEVEAVQVFSRALVEEYGYPKDHIQTRPQFRVKARPSDVKKEYPVDIAVFSDAAKTDDSIQIVVECKKKNRKDGLTQLKDYLRFSTAAAGVWFNGEERMFIRKIEKEGKVFFEEIPNIPRYGERLEDVGQYRRNQLLPAHNMKPTFKAVRNYLAANNVGATRDEVLAQQLINIIFCKIIDERNTRPNDICKFRSGIGENPEDVKARIVELFNAAKRKYKEVFEDEDVISLDANSICYIVGELYKYCLIETERDVLSDAFEIFIGHALKGGQGQFFTPRNVIKMIVEMLDISEEDIIIDPACGSGGFLLEVLRELWRQQDEELEEYNLAPEEVREEKIEVATRCIRGIDKDYFLTKLTKAYMAIMRDGKGGIFCEDSLEHPTNWKTETQQKIKLGDFNVVVTNPPFGSKIPVTGEDKLKQYELAHKWSYDKSNDTWEKGKLAEKEAPQILFIERCYQLLADKGRMGIVLPDGIFGNTNLGYIRQYILERFRLVAVVDIPIETFMPNTGTKTSILIAQKLAKDEIPEDYPVFMAMAETCGHDRRGNTLPDDDIARISGEFKKWKEENNFSYR